MIFFYHIEALLSRRQVIFSHLLISVFFSGFQHSTEDYACSGKIINNTQKHIANTELERWASSALPKFSDAS